MNFEATIRIENTFYTFIFTEIKSSYRLKYFVRTKTQKGENIFFEIVQISGEDWMVVPPIPDWISAHERDLIALIQIHRT